MLLNLTRWLNGDQLREPLLYKCVSSPSQKVHSFHEIQSISCMCVHICIYYVSVYPFLVSIGVMTSSERVRDMPHQNMLLRLVY